MVCVGLSPRVRGKRRRPQHGRGAIGSIPACAGETIRSRLWKIRPQVYPRVCGGNPSPCKVVGAVQGLSPRVRGKRIPTGCWPMRWRSIPACAGETPGRQPFSSSEGVYPRVCGGNPPAGRGCHQPRGLSPRVRGKRITPYPRGTSLGSIPACAGETLSISAVTSRGTVYPRVCGGNHYRSPAPPPGCGLSPRVRGKLRWRWGLAAPRGSIPACAGETRCRLHPSGASRVYPRVCGGNRTPSSPRSAARGLSPRVRGKPNVGGRGGS